MFSHCRSLIILLDREGDAACVRSWLRSMKGAIEELEIMVSVIWTGRVSNLKPSDLCTKECGTPCCAQ